jgi:hypothetical protein
VVELGAVLDADEDVESLAELSPELEDALDSVCAEPVSAALDSVLDSDPPSDTGELLLLA